MKRDRWIELLLLLVLWAVLAWRGFPFPNVDDGLFTGAALNLATGGGLRNPLLEASGPYYLYPPFYDYFLAGWLRIAGTGFAAMAGFHLAVCFATSALLLEIFRKWNRDEWGWVGVLLYVDYIAYFGLRSDALGLLFIVLSVRLGLTASRPCAGVAPFFALLGMATHPPLLALAVPWVFWLAWTKPPARIGVVAGVVGVGVLFLVLIGGDLFGFIQGFLKNAAESRLKNTRWLLGEWFRAQNIFKIVLLPVFSLVLAVRKMKCRGAAASDVAFLLALSFGFYAMLGSLTGNRLLGLISVLGVLGYLTAWPNPGKKGRMAIWIALAIFCASIGRPLVEGLVMEKPSGAEMQQIRSDLKKVAYDHLVVDWWSLRYVFDFRPPANTVYLLSSRRPRDGYALLFPGECGLISVEATDEYGLLDPGLPRPVYWRIAGRPVGRWIINASEIALITKTAP